MTPVRFGKTGLKVSPIALGCMSYGDPSWREWVLTEGPSMPYYRQAYEAGVTFWDTADVYSTGVSETITGKAIRQFAAKREEIVLATKVHGALGPGANQKGLSRKHIMEAVDASLKRLDTDYIDLYIIHRFDPDVPMEETVSALNDVVRAGKALYLGASSMYAWQFMKFLSLQRQRGFAEFASMQNFYNLIYREEEREMMPLCAAEGIAVTPWSPLARGYLAGSGPAPEGSNGQTVRGRTDPYSKTLRLGEGQDKVIRERLIAEATKLGVKPSVLALAWVMSKPFVTSPIVGSTKPYHLEDAVAATALKLDDATIAALEEPYQPKAIAGHS